MELSDYIQFVLMPQVINGLALGIAVTLVALGLTIIFGLLDVINMSHGEFYAIGAFGAISLGALGLNFWVMLALVPLLMAPMGVLAERVLSSGFSTARIDMSQPCSSPSVCHSSSRTFFAWSTGRTPTVLMPRYPEHQNSSVF